MPISNLPGVGPANSDIAATIATTPAVSAQITASVPSTSAIAAAVPNLTQITSAITSNAASAGVTIAAITSAGNSAGWGTSKGPLDITWTSLGFSGGSGTTNVNFTGLSGYRILRIFIYSQSISSTPNATRFRLNGDTTNNYTSSLAGNMSSSTSQNIDNYALTDGFWVTSATVSQFSGIIDIMDANQSIPKKVQVNTIWRDSSGNRVDQNNFYQYMSTSAITSLNFFSAGIFNPAIANSGFYIYGGN